ncbi:MAG: NUDIX hydrolase [Candidatus Sericytochromatia bacterium]|nr:NUDIX hydrolase [Candidatus Sericytochromatia bacterium]
MTDPEANPWQTLSTRRVYDNPWIGVREDQVLRPDGEPGIYGVVEFKNLAIGIVPVDENGYTWLVGQYRYTMDEYTWEIPAGGCPPGETPLETAVRELAEEVGLTATRWTSLGPVQLSNSCTAERGEIFLAEGLTMGESAPEGSEVLQIEKIPLQRALDMAHDGRIADGVSIIGLWRAARTLAERGNPAAF